MRSFEDESGETWVATVEEREGNDYKGRFRLVMRPEDGEDASLVVGDILWNSERTARRTLETMSLVELRRKLGVARGRAAPR